MPPRLSVVIPAYNESKRIGPTLASIQSFVQPLSYDIEVIVVINNTTDNTREVIESFRSHMPYITVVECGIQESQSGTKGLAVQKGVFAASGDYILYMDADNAAQLSEIKRFWPVFEQGYDIVFGSRYIAGAVVHRVWYRNIMGRLSNILVQLLLLPGIRDTQCGFKAFTQKAGKDIFSTLETIGWGFDMEVLARARKANYKIKEVPIEWHEVGQSSVKGTAFLNAFKELLAIRKSIRKKQ